MTIVAGHCFGISGWKIDSFSERVVGNIISGGTSLFVFISGVLFHHVFYPAFHYRSFMRKKINNVLFPYLFLASFAIAQALILRAPFADYYFGPEPTVMDQIIRPIVLYLVTGGVYVYWYIPFIMCIFLMSPLFIRFIHLPARARIGLTILFLVISLFLQRPVNNFLVPQSVLFFLPVYLFGILCSMHRDWVYRHLGNRCTSLLAAALLLAVLQALLVKSCGDLQKPPFQFHGIDINLLQKMVFCLFFMNFLHRFEEVNSRILKTIASSSFAIYFLHGWLIYLVSLIQTNYRAAYGLQLVPLFTILITWASYLLASFIKARFPVHSRKLIGW